MGSNPILCLLSYYLSQKYHVKNNSHISEPYEYMDSNNCK